MFICITPLVSKATNTCTSVQLSKAHELAEERGHSNLSKILKNLSEVVEITSKGEGEETVAAINTEEGRKVLGNLKRPRDPKGDCHTLTCMHAHMHTHTHARMHAHTHTHTHTHAHTHARTHTHRLCREGARSSLLHCPNGGQSQARGGEGDV